MTVICGLLEQKRIELQNLVKVKGLSSPETVRCSQELDVLINEWQREPLATRRKVYEKEKIFS